MIDDDTDTSEEPSVPETDSVSPYCLISKKLHDAAHRALGTQADRRPSSFFAVAPNVDKESLLAHCCETLASANVMASELAFSLTGPQCNMLLGIQQMISLAELSVNRVLDQVDPHE